MKPIDQRIEPLILAMEQDPGTPKGAAQDLRQAIAESPFLSNLLAQAVEDGKIAKINISTDKHSGGYFNDEAKSLNINANAFRDFPTQGAKLDYITEVVGHETMHGILAPARAQALTEFAKDMGARLQKAHDERQTSVNLTEPTRTYLDFTRTDEALAETAGLRALASRVREQNQGISEADLEGQISSRSTSACIVESRGTRSLAKGVDIGELDVQQAPFKRDGATTKAIEACFYDGNASSLGKHGDSDYRNHYGVYPISKISIIYDYLSKDRRPPDIQVDMKSIGLDPKQLERNGLDLGPMKSLPFLDLGKDGYGMVQLHSTGKNGVPTPERAAGEDMGTPRPSDPSHTDHAMYRQIRTGVEALDQQQGRSFDQTSDRITHSLLATAKGSGFERVDHVVMGRPPEQPGQAQNIFAVQGGLRDLTMMRAHVDSDVAARTPVEQSVAQLHTVNQQLAAEKSQQQTADINRTQEQVQKPMQHSL